ncbi:MAG: hypothetical protein JWP18_789, partial [Solirubrobacterales bacterium]|nr:hypothetical protein [Solirubrobacterales bacterium]
LILGGAVCAASGRLLLAEGSGRRPAVRVVQRLPPPERVEGRTRARLL